MRPHVAHLWSRPAVEVLDWAAVGRVRVGAAYRRSEKPQFARQTTDMVAP